MATEVDLILHENNDETLALTITPDDITEDLTTITTLELYLKQQNCTDDSDPLTLLLSSDNPAEINILTQTPSEITASAFIPASALANPYDRFWRLDAISGSGDRRTAIFGDVDVVNL